MTEIVYPPRESMFAVRFQRELIRRGVAQVIGPDTCWLLSIIAAAEDELRYARPVNFYNGQLMLACGIGSENRLNDVRKRAIDAGWLRYQPGAKRRPGVYFVMIPDDDPLSIPLQNGGVSGGNPEIHPRIPLRNGGAIEIPPASPPVSPPETEVHPVEIRGPSSPMPLPAPNPKDSSSSSSFEALTAELRACGVHRAAETIEAALANGMAVDRILAIIEHWRKYPERWPVAILVERLKLGDTELLPHEGWFGESPEWSKGQKATLERGKGQLPSSSELEERCGDDLDRLTLAELKTLSLKSGDRDVRFYVPDLLKQGDDPRTNPMLRRALLLALAENSARIPAGV